MEECLRTTRGMNLEDMFDWVSNAILAFFIFHLPISQLYLHFPENEMIIGLLSGSSPSPLPS